MQFKFSNQNLSPGQKLLERFFQMLPGAISWAILGVLIGLCFLKPLTAAAVIIAFNFYWLLRLIYMNVFLALSRSRLKLEEKTDWLGRAKGINRIYDYWKELGELEAAAKGKRDISLLILKKEIRILEKSKQKAPLLEDLHHLVILPVEAGQEAFISRTVASLIGGNFSSIKITVILAFDQKVSESSKLTVRRLIERYREKFFDFFAVYYPGKSYTGKPFKGAIVSYATEEAARYFKEKKVAYERVVVSSLKPGVVVNPDYLSCLSYRYVVSPRRQTACFQSLPVYDSSIWQVKASKRVLEASASAFQLVEAINPDNLVSFSGYSMSLATLVELEFWPPDLISADTAIFWKAFIYFNTAFTVKPLYVEYPINIESGPESWKSYQELYQRKKQLSFAAENFPIVMRAFLKSWRMPFARKVSYGFKMLEAQVSTSIWPFIVFVISWLPALFAGREFSDANIYYSAPRITFLIFALMFLSVIACISLTNRIFPTKKYKLGFLKQIVHFLVLVFIVPVGIFLTATANLTTQTNLFFGRRPKL